ncbi:transcriptional regulator TbsP domain-containing protein [Halorubrum ezzemoulense]|uniref:transcriptional regulator TbsP domain-containing protein n=1 Tax=Halorubrum ezzemoulense TaxID=337243 RepID=UPI0034E0E20E
MLILAARNKVLLHDISNGERIRISLRKRPSNGPNQHSKMLAASETEKVPINIGCPRLRLIATESSRQQT